MGLRVLVEYGLMGFGFWVAGSLRVLNFSGYTRSRVTRSMKCFGPERSSRPTTL